MTFRSNLITVYLVFCSRCSRGRSLRDKSQDLRLRAKNSTVSRSGADSVDQRLFLRCWVGWVLVAMRIRVASHGPQQMSSIS